MRLRRTSPAYDAHVAAAAVFGDKNGWRRVNYFAANATRGDDSRRPLGPGGEEWSSAIEAEHRAVREAAGLFDLTSFGKTEVSGPGAATLLESLCSNRVSRGPGKITYTQMLNAAGGVIADVTIAQIGETSFLVVSGTSALEHDFGWISEHAAGQADVTVRDVTSSFSCFGVWGPLARDVLQPLVNISLAAKDFPYMTTGEAPMGDVTLRLSRVTFVGELGWEIYAPTEYGRSLWQQLSDAVAAVGGLRCGYRAIDSLRSEKGYLYLGADLTADRTPVASGLGAFVRLNKDFIGRDDVLAASPPDEILRGLVLNDEWYSLQGGEMVQLPGGRTTTITSAGMGYTVGAAIGFAFLPTDLEPGTAVQVLLDHGPVDATVVLQPLYDATGERIRA
jgi:glycine cleavage system aminomethyltransferase T